MVEYKEKATRQHENIQELNKTIKEIEDKNSYHYSQMVEYKEKATRQHENIQELNKKYHRLLNSKSYKVGLVITLPFRLLKKLFQRITK